jgi:hypothetical protein
VQRFPRRDRHFPLVGTSAREARRALRSPRPLPIPVFDVTIAGALNLDLILYGLPEARTPEREGPCPTAHGGTQIERLTSEQFRIYYGHLRLLAFWCGQAYCQ